MSTRSQLQFTWTVPVCTYVRRVHAGQGSLVASMSFGIVYTRAFAGDRVSAYAFRLCVWMVGEELLDGKKVEGGEVGGVQERRWRPGWRQGGVAGGVRQSVSPFGWSDNCPCWTTRSPKIMASIYVRRSTLSCMMPGVTLQSCAVGTTGLVPSFSHPLQKTHTKVAQHGHRPSTQCSTT